jgi:DNA-binding transcriptional LysR family regulator
MDLRDLRYFETIAELQHVSAAADKLHRTQPALTASVRRLEAFCGAELFERCGRGIRLTEAGKTMLVWARRLRLGVADAHREVEALGKGLSGHIRLGIVPTAAQYWIPVMLQQFMERAPAVTISTTVGMREALCDKLRAGDVDVVVSPENPQALDLDSQWLAEDRFVVVANEAHPLHQAVEKGKSLNIAELGGFEWVLQQPGTATRDWIDHAFDRVGQPRPRVRIESDMLVVLPALTVGQDLLGFVSIIQLQHTGAAMGLRELPVSGLTMRRQLVAMWRRSGYVHPAARIFVQLLTEAGSRMAE